MNFRTLPSRLKALVVAQAATALLVLGWVATGPLPQRWDLLLFLMVCGAVGGAFKVDLGMRLGHMTLGFTVTSFSVLLLGTPSGILVGLAATLAGIVMDTRTSAPRLDLGRLLGCQSAFNISNSVVATAGLGLSYHALGGRTGYTPLEQAGLPIVVSTLVYFLINVGAVTLAIAWSRKLAPAQVYAQQFAWSWPGFLGGAGVSACLLWLHQTLGLTSPAWLILPPAYVVWSLHRLRLDRTRAEAEHMQEMNRLNEAIISSLAMAIEAKDPNTRKHVNRVREYAVRLARALGVTPDEQKAIQIASLLHDIGKVGIPEQILCKQGKLTAEEFEIIKSHVDLGAALLEQVKFPWPVVPVVRTHHERWDGLGYPQGLKGEEIPIGGRIISLVDVFDALTSDRPYRRAVSRDQAIRMIRAASGTQFDPRVVDKFIEMLPEMEAAVAHMNPDDEPGWAAIMENFSHLAPPVQPDDWPCDEKEDARVIEALADLDHAGSDLSTLAPLLGERLRDLVPFTTLAVYTPDSSRRILTPIHLDGLWIDQLSGMEIRIGEGISGVVAASGEPIFNANAALDVSRRVRPGENQELNSTLSVPIVVGGELLGVLTVYHSSYNFYQPYHFQRLQRVSTCLADATVARTGQEEMPLLRDDPVTGLPSAGALVQFLQGMVTVAELREEEFAVVRFRLGPGPGDTGSHRVLLELLTATLKDVVRDGDFLARDEAPSGEWGFALVLPRCGARQAVGIVGRVCERVHADARQLLHHDMRLEAEIRLFPQDGRTASSLLAQPPQGNPDPLLRRFPAS